MLNTQPQVPTHPFCGPNGNPWCKAAFKGVSAKKLQFFYVASPSWSLLDVGEVAETFAAE